MGGNIAALFPNPRRELSFSSSMKCQFRHFHVSSNTARHVGESVNWHGKYGNFFYFEPQRGLKTDSEKKPGRWFVIIPNFMEVIYNLQ
jgi:hypothetical protein